VFVKAKEQEKLCPHCEGRISVTAEICPYCATEQSVSKEQTPFHSPLFENQTLQDSLTSLYTPPYQGKRPQFGEIPHEAEDPPASPYTSSPTYQDVTSAPPQEDPLIGATVELDEETPRSTLSPMLSLLCGVYLFLIGFMQLCFAKEGVLHLEWNARFWFLFILFSAPLLYFGIKQLKNFNKP